MFLELIHLVFSKVHFVWGVSFEWKRVIWILWMTLMVDVIFTILPVRVFSLVMAHLWCGGIILVDGLELTWYLLHLKWHKGRLLSGCHFHTMRVDYARLLLHVECVVFLWYDFCLLDFILEFLLVVWCCALGVRILYKPICAAVSASALVAQSWAWYYNILVLMTELNDCDLTSIWKATCIRIHAVLHNFIRSCSSCIISALSCWLSSSIFPKSSIINYFILLPPLLLLIEHRLAIFVRTLLHLCVGSIRNS